MSSRPLKIPGHRPLSRPESRDRPFSAQKLDPRLGPPARCLSRRRQQTSSQPNARAAISARENALRRLRKVAEVHAEARQPPQEVRRELIDILLHLRVHSLEVVEAIERWRNSSGRAGAAWIDPSTGENYLLKIKTDTQWLADSPLGEILTFSPKPDPFFVVPSARESHTAPTNQMTPTLQARKQMQGNQRKAALPLQSSLLRRIRASELLIIKESVQARMQNGFAPSSAAPVPSPGDAAAGGTLVATASAARKSSAPSLTASSECPSAHLPASSGLGASASLSEGLALQAEVTIKPAAVVTGPPPHYQRPETISGAFQMYPVDATVASIRETFDNYSSRVDPRLLATLEEIKTLETMLTGGGAATPEWFWLFRNSCAGSGSSEPDGLAVFRIQKKSTTFAQLLHLSIVGDPMDASDFEEALQVVKTWMFAWLPIRSIRATLWYTEIDDDFKLVPEIESTFKKGLFRWFQLTNSEGRRGQVMNRPRGEPPIDPEAPQDMPCLQVCVGQAWFRDGITSRAAVPRLGACASNLVMAARSVQHLWGRDTCDEVPGTDASKSSMREAAREGLVRGLLSGELSKLLSKYTPTTLTVTQQTAGRQGSTGSPDIVRQLAQSLESSGSAVPGVQCEGSTDVVDLVQRLSGASGYAEAIEGLGVDTLPDMIAALGPRDAAFTRLFVTFDWIDMNVIDGDTFEVPVHAVGACPKHPHRVFYLGTSEDDAFVVVIPWGGVAVPEEERAFAACVEVLRSTEPLETTPVSAVRLSGFSARVKAHTVEVCNSSALGFPGAPRMHVSEFSSLLVSAGREMPGALRQAPAGGSGALAVARPFMIGIWHTGIDDLNVPLFATMVA